MIPKFRAWDNRSKKMWKVSTLHIEDEYVDLFEKNIYENPFNDPSAKFGDVILMQSTGLKDKNGVDVYQGDIIRCTRGCPHEVIWLEEYGGTFFGGMPAWYLSGLKKGYAWTGEEEVIGNIYENPELLEGTE
ncbi:DNA-packaging protein [Enterococcus faecalis]|nr:DNA-packaging protein [Enterococcus faecalis]